MSSSIISSCSIVSVLVSFSLCGVYNLVSITPFAGHMKWHWVIFVTGSVFSRSHLSFKTFSENFCKFDISKVCNSFLR